MKDLKKMLLGEEYPGYLSKIAFWVKLIEKIKKAWFAVYVLIVFWVAISTSLSSWGAFFVPTGFFLELLAAYIHRWIFRWEDMKIGEAQYEIDRTDDDYLSKGEWVINGLFNDEKWSVDSNGVTYKGRLYHYSNIKGLSTNFGKRRLIEITCNGGSFLPTTVAFPSYYSNYDAEKIADYIKASCTRLEKKDYTLSPYLAKKAYERGDLSYAEYQYYLAGRSGKTLSADEMAENIAFGSVLDARKKAETHNKEVAKSIERRAIMGGSGSWRRRRHSRCYKCYK